MPGARYENDQRHGDWNAICDECGFKFKASELRKRWDGAMVCQEDFEVRHPQDFLKGKPDSQSLPWTRPDSERVIVDIEGNSPTGVSVANDDETNPYPCCGESSLATLLSITITGGTSVATGKTLQLAAIANYSDGTSVDVTTKAAWASASSAVDSVVAGLVTATSGLLASESATISATYILTDTHDITVTVVAADWEFEGSCPNPLPINTGQTGLTYHTSTGWITCNDSTLGRSVIMNWFEGFNDSYGLLIQDEGYIWYDDRAVGDGDEILTPIPLLTIPDGEDAFYCMELDKANNRMRIRINLDQDSGWFTVTTSMAGFGASHTLYFGARDSTSGYWLIDGTICWPRLYNRVITDEEFLALYNEGV